VSRARAALSASIAALCMLGCGEPEVVQRPSDVQAELAADVATVVRVSWRTDVATVGYVEYGPDPAMAFSTPLEATPALEHSQLLLGLHGDTAYSFRVVTWDGREAGASQVESVQTGTISAEIPTFSQAGAGFDQLLVLPIRGASPGVVIVDATGAVVWYHLDTSGLEPLRARLSDDKSRVLYNEVSVDEPSEDSAIVEVALDGSDERSRPVPLLGPDFLELPDGTLATLTADPNADGVRDDSIVEVGADGNLSKVWSVSDCFDLAQLPGDSSASAGAYANSLDYVDAADPAERAYYVGLRNFSSIVKVLPETGECAWVLGTTAATLKFSEDSAAFVHQSGFDVYGGRALVMDNGAPADTSRVVEYELDAKAGTASERQSYLEPTGSNVGELGSATRLVDGSWFVNWADLGRAELVKDGSSVWQLSAKGARFGYHTLTETPYAADSRRPRAR
jgi:hypothetical protein